MLEKRLHIRMLKIINQLCILEKCFQLCTFSRYTIPMWYIEAIPIAVNRMTIHTLDALVHTNRGMLYIRDRADNEIPRPS